MDLLLLALAIIVMAISIYFGFSYFREQAGRKKRFKRF